MYIAWASRPMRFAALLLICSTAWGQSFPSLERLFTRPYVWGTKPSSLRWAKKSSVVIFLWNSEGKRFLDLYAWHADPKKLVRLTDLESDKDDLNLSEEQRDDRLRRYLAPPPGLADYDVSQDGRRVAFSHKGDIYLAATDGSSPLLRLTRTKAPESSPAFAPDGSALASIRGGQVIVQNLSNGQIWQATEIESGTLSVFDWSPDGKTLACIVAKGGVRQLPLPNFSGRLITARNFDRSIAGDEPEEQSIVLAPVDGGKGRVVDRGGDRWEVNDLRWSPDSQHLVLAHLSPDYKKRQVAVIDIATAKPKIVFEETDNRWVDYGFAVGPQTQNKYCSRVRRTASRTCTECLERADRRFRSPADLGRYDRSRSLRLHSGPGIGSIILRRKKEHRSDSSIASSRMDHGRRSSHQRLECTSEP